MKTIKTINTSDNTIELDDKTVLQIANPDDMAHFRVNDQLNNGQREYLTPRDRAMWAIANALNRIADKLGVKQ